MGRALFRFCLALFIGAGLCAPAGPAKASSADEGIEAPVGGYRSRIVSIKELRFRHVIPQKQDFTCGSAALATLMLYQYGQDIGEKQIILDILAHGKKMEVAQREGFSLLDLKGFAQRHGYHAIGYAHQKVADLLRHGAPPIIPVNINGYRHFVIARDVEDGQVFLADPALGNVRLPISDLESIWQGGVAFFVLPSSQQTRIANHMAAQSADYAFAGFQRTPLRVAIPYQVTRRSPLDDVLANQGLTR